MNSIETGGPAFPVPEHQDPRGWQMEQTYGMTLRDYFAARAMQANRARSYESWDDLAKDAYAMARAMLKAREAQP